MKKLLIILSASMAMASAAEARFCMAPERAALFNKLKGMMADDNSPCNGRDDEEKCTTRVNEILAKVSVAGNANAMNQQQCDFLRELIGD